MLLQIGTQLFTALFSGEIGKLYAASRSMLEDDQGLAIRLSIPPGAEEIAALAWEFMADPDEGLGENVKITLEPHMTAAILRERLREEFHIWHFVGHGGFDKAGKTAQLLFEDASGDADAISAMELNIMLNRSGIRLVVLNACDSGKLAIEPFRSIAPALIRAQIPAVVAQQFRVPAEATREFVTDFYRSLAIGLPINACITEGRKAIMNSCGFDQADWGMPVFYTRTESRRLYDPPEVTSAPAPMPIATPAPAATPASAPLPTPVDTRAAERAEQIVALTALLQAKRREQCMLRHGHVLL